jgi:uncharacterized protein (DUF433 family)
MTAPSSVVRSDPAILGGTPVFVGTRVPFQTFFDYLVPGEITGRLIPPGSGSPTSIIAAEVSS